MKQSRTQQSIIIDNLFSNRNINELSTYLQQYPNYNLLDIIDSQGNTVLHQLAYEGHHDIILLYIKEARKQLSKRFKNQGKKIYQKNQSQQIACWINKANNQGFTPLLYACYSGHLDIIRLLIEEHQVNYKVTTKSGLNVLHLAAQKNIISTFLYFRGRVSLQQKDELNSTALHWAAYMNSEHVVAYILSETLASIDQKDRDGNTPLMVAVSYGNTRVVRRLLLKGANRYIPNKEGKIPLQVAKASSFKTITRMLNQQYTASDMLKFYCNIKIQYKPKGRRWTIPFVFLITFAITLGILNIFINFQKDYQLYIEAGLMFVTLLLYFSLLIGPNRIQPMEYSYFLKQKTQKNLKKICFECKNSIPKRGYHCDVCGVCIKQYDHHCTWINNCVGKRNLGRFIFFLTFLILAMGFVGFYSFLVLFSNISDKSDLYREWFTYRLQYNEQMQKILLLVLFSLTFLTSLFIFPVFMLLIVQLKNLLKNKTTYQTIRGPPQQQNPIKTSMRRYNSKVSLRNCRTMCKDNRKSFQSSSSRSSQQLMTDQYQSEDAH